MDDKTIRSPLLLIQCKLPTGELNTSALMTAAENPICISKICP